MNQSTTKTPVHLWIVGFLAVLWNSGGAYDYVATQFADTRAATAVLFALKNPAFIMASYSADGKALMSG